MYNNCEQSTFGGEIKRKQQAKNLQCAEESFWSEQDNYPLYRPDSFLADFHSTASWISRNLVDGSIMHDDGFSESKGQLKPTLKQPPTPYIFNDSQNFAPLKFESLKQPLDFVQFNSPLSPSPSFVSDYERVCYELDGILGPGSDAGGQSSAGEMGSKSSLSTMTFQNKNCRRRLSTYDSYTDPSSSPEISHECSLSYTGQCPIPAFYFPAKMSMPAERPNKKDGGVNKRKKKKQTKSYCEFCLNNDEDEQVWSTHRCKDEYGDVVCPVLASHICEACGATGKRAHTLRYCPVKKERELKKLATSSDARSRFLGIVL